MRRIIAEHPLFIWVILIVLMGCAKKPNREITGINTQSNTINGTAKIRFFNSAGEISNEQSHVVKLDSFVRTDIPVAMVLPTEAGGYVLVAEFTPENGTPVISRRFLKIGHTSAYSFYHLNPFKQ